MPLLGTLFACPTFAPLWLTPPTLLLTPCSLATLTPASRSLGTRISTSPLQQCLAINAWLILVAGIALPLAALSALEQQARRLWHQRRLRQQQRQQLAGTPDPSAGDFEYMENCEAAGMHEWLICGWQALFQSSIAWGAACLAAAVLLHASPE